MTTSYKVSAVWDSDARVFTSQSEIPGLVIEADTFEQFVELVEALGPEMLEANMPNAQRPFLFEIQSHRALAVA